jgi:hypothetical protein
MSVTKIGGIMAGVLLLGAGCGQPSDRPPAMNSSGATNASVVVDVRANLPKGFPDDVPVKSDARFLTSTERDGKLRSALFGGIGTTEAWEQYYRKALGDAGWNVGVGLRESGGAIFDASKLGHELVTVVVAKDPGRSDGVIVNVVFGPHPFK